MAPDPGVTVALEEPLLGLEIGDDHRDDDHRDPLDEGEEEPRDADQQADQRQGVPGGLADHGAADR
jgi:hypothetical protein